MSMNRTYKKNSNATRKHKKCYKNKNAIKVVTNKKNALRSKELEKEYKQWKKEQNV